MLIELQQSCVQQLTTNTGEKLPWEVFNEAGEKLWTLEASTSEKEIFNIQDYAKHFEAKAFDVGMKEMKRRMSLDLEEQRLKFERVLTLLQVENIRLGTALGNAIGASEEEDAESKIGIPENMR